MKSRFLGLILSVFCLSHIATADNASSFYAGASAGMSNVYVRYMFFGGAGNNTIMNKSDNGKTNPNGSLFAGYHFPVLDRVYVDTELYVLYQNTKINNTVDMGTSWNGWSAFSRKKESYGIAFLIGTPIFELSSPTSIYLRLGVENGKYESNTIDSPGGGFGNTQASKNYVSFVPGAGIKSKLTEKLFLRVDYSYVPGPTLKTYDTVTPWSHHFSFSEQRFMISLGYQF